MNYLFNISACLFLVILQTTIIPYLPLLDKFYDLLIPFIVYLGLSRPVRESLPFVLFLGFIMDNLSGGPFGLYLTTYFWLFVGDGLTCLAALVLLLIFFSARESHQAAMKMEPGLQDRSPWKDGPFLMLMLLIIVLASVFLQIFSTFPIYLREVYLLGEEKIGMLIACNALIIILFEMLLIKAVEKMNLMLLVGLGCFLTCLGFFLLPFGSSLIFVLFTIVVWTCGEHLSSM